MFEQSDRYIDVVTKEQPRERTVGPLWQSRVKAHAPKCTGSILDWGTKIPHPTHAIETNFKRCGNGCFFGELFEVDIAAGLPRYKPAVKYLPLQ